MFGVIKEIYTKLLRRFTIWRTKKVSRRRFVIVMSIIIGILGGLASVALSKFTSLIKEFVSWAFIGDKDFAPYYFILPTIGIFITFLVKKYVIKEPVRPGIATVLNSISKDKSSMHPRTTYSYFITAPFTVGFGGSVGLEAPVIGAAIGSNIARALHLNKQMYSLFLACATAAALSAIFKTPITGIIFVIELFSIDLTISALVPLMLSSSTGLLVSYALTGQNSMFNFVYTSKTGIDDFPFIIVLAVLAAYFSVHFTKIHVFSTKFFSDKVKNSYVKIILGGTILGTLIFFMPALYGEGFLNVAELLSARHDKTGAFPWLGTLAESTLIISVVFFAMMYFKSIATTVTFGSGGIGGFFAPSIFLGAVFGYAFAIFINKIFPQADLSLANFTLIGMAAVFSGIIQTPFAAVFFITELTQGYDLILPLIIVSALSFFITKKHIGHSVYTESLVREGSLITQDKDKSVIRLININQLIENDFKSVEPTMSLGEICNSAVSKSNRNIFPVLDKQGILLGVIYLDSLRKVMFREDLHDKFNAYLLMKKPPEVIVLSEDTMENVVSKFRDSQLWNLPVIDKKGKYLGFISKSKLLSVYRQRLKELSTEDILEE